MESCVNRLLQEQGPALDYEVSGHTAILSILFKDSKRETLSRGTRTCAESRAAGVRHVKVRGMLETQKQQIGCMRMG